MPKPPNAAHGPDGRYIRTLETAERDAEICRMRAQGMSLRAIAQKLGMHHSSVKDACDRALRATVEEPAENLRKLELARLDHLYEVAAGVLQRQHVTVSNGRVVTLDGEPLPDDGPILAAIDRMLKIQERRARLLGLDAPSRVSVDAQQLGAEILALIEGATNGHDSTS